jgi:1-acyl-sn-glycerol-3-phosphate acyltransferase
VEGAGRTPAPPYVVVSNHQGQWEAFCFQTLFHPLIVVVKKELLRVPLFGWALATLRPIAIQRDKPRQAAGKILTEGADRLGRGLSVLLFPEGTRMAPGVLGRYKRTSLGLASQNCVPVVPVVHNSGDCWPARRFIKYPGIIRVVIGEPIVVGTQIPEKMNEIVSWSEITLKKIREMNA